MAAPDISLPAVNVSNIMQQSLENIACAILTIIIGYVIVRILIFKLEDYAEKYIQIPKIMMTHITNAIRWFFYLIVILLALAFLDEDIDAVILSISALVTFILGFGLQDTINNLASGIWIASARAYDIEDEVTLAGHRGYVKNVNIMSTELKQIDNTRVIIPNSKVWNNPIINVTRMPTRMIVLEYSVSYSTVISDAVSVALKAADKHPKIHSDPEPIVRFKEMADSAVILQLRAWVDTADYYPVRSDLMRSVFEDLNAAGIQIPFPQVDVHMKHDI